MTEPKITRLEVHQFQFEPAEPMAGEGRAVHTPGDRYSRSAYALRILTDIGVTGEYVGGSGADYANLPSFLHHLIGKTHWRESASTSKPNARHECGHASVRRQ